MKQITVKVPENQYEFFLELMKNLGFEPSGKNDYVFSPSHRKILEQRLADLQKHPKEETNWSSVKKKLKSKLGKTK